MHYLRLLVSFVRVSAQEELAYRSNFFVSLLNSLLNLGTGVLGTAILFSQVKSIHGWNFSETLALLGIYLTLSALRGLFIGPSLDALAGLDGEIWQGRFDFTLLRPINAQFLASFRHWRLLTCLDLLLGIGVLLFALFPLLHTLTLFSVVSFLLTLCTSVIVLYAILITFAALIFWSPGFLFTWVFDSLFQIARYPIGLYPNWLQFILTWLIPIGIMTTIPAQAISGHLSLPILVGSSVVSLVLLIAASLLFQLGLRRYSSASS
jgi:ABC-2 type transport system permease protein